MANKIAVIYKSRYGSTKKYAEWISENVGADLLKGSQVKSEDLINYDTIIYGGNLHAGRISGKELIVNNFDKIADKNIIIFYVSASEVNEKAIAYLRAHFPENMREKIKLFGLRGAFNYQKLGLIDKLIMLIFKMVIKSKNPDKLTEYERGVLASCENPADYTDKNTIEPIIVAINKN